MTLLRLLLGALRGWAAILAGRPDWRRHFRISVAGLIGGLVTFILVALIATLLENFGRSVGGMAIEATLAVEMLSLLALLAGSWMVKLLQGGPAQVMVLTIPGLYGLAGFVALRTIVAGFALPATALVLLALALALFRLGRMAGGWSIMASAVYAVLVSGLLVGLPWTLYMVGNPAPAPL